MEGVEMNRADFGRPFRADVITDLPRPEGLVLFCYAISWLLRFAQ
jgi:hypothetical protein